MKRVRVVVSAIIDLADDDEDTDADVMDALCEVITDVGAAAILTLESHELMYTVYKEG